jgi:N-acetylglucosaminyldiphosphoundecaprenol N-acetyl-beta-D-mannosaminyltransferase
MQMRRREGEEVPESVEAFGVKISPVSMIEALDKVETFIKTGQPHHVLTSDANAILTSRQDPEYAAIMRRAALITPDGFGVIWGARLLNLPIYERVTGVDMVTGICERAAKNGYKIFIFGSEPGIASTAATNLAVRYPGLQIVGTHHGMVMREPEALAKVIAQIREAKPDVLFVAMGIPLQEKFIAKHLDELGVPVALGVGGSFDVYAGKFRARRNMCSARVWNGCIACGSTRRAGSAWVTCRNSCWSRSKRGYSARTAEKLKRFDEGLVMLSSKKRSVQ